MSLFLPTYFSPISQYAALVNTNKITFELEDNYVKQTYRNRCYIFGANGKQVLNIPVKFPSTSEKKKTKEALVDNTSNWQLHHLKSLQSAYRNSPFFEFYIDDLLPIFQKKYKFLMDVNMDSFMAISTALEINTPFSKTKEYQTKPLEKDLRFLANTKSHSEKENEKYIQMFDEKYGFLPNLSILDLLFMEGPNAINLL
jgi:hypothetical protein